MRPVLSMMLHGRKRHADELAAGTRPRLDGASWVHDADRADDAARGNERGADDDDLRPLFAYRRVRLRPARSHCLNMAADIVLSF